MTFVGIDPSLTRTALAVVGDEGHGRMRVWQSTGKRDATVADRLGRIHDIMAFVLDALHDEQPTAWAIEGPAFSRNNAGAFDRAGAWWLILERADDEGFGLPLVVPPNVRAKYATGKGNAGKDEVLAAVVRRYPWTQIQNNDEADAYVIGCILARLHGQPIEDSLPATHLDALKKVTLP